MNNKTALTLITTLTLSACATAPSSTPTNFRASFSEAGLTHKTNWYRAGDSLTLSWGRLKPSATTSDSLNPLEVPVSWTIQIKSPTEAKTYRAKFLPNVVTANQTDLNIEKNILYCADQLISTFEVSGLSFQHILTRPDAYPPADSSRCPSP